MRTNLRSVLRTLAPAFFIIGLLVFSLDRVTAADQGGVLGQEPGVLGVVQGHARGVARAEQRLELVGELLHFLVLQRGQRHHGFPSR